MDQLYKNIDFTLNRISPLNLISLGIALNILLLARFPVFGSYGTFPFNLLDNDFNWLIILMIVFPPLNLIKRFFIFRKKALTLYFVTVAILLFFRQTLKSFETVYACNINLDFLSCSISEYATSIGSILATSILVLPALSISIAIHFSDKIFRFFDVFQRITLIFLIPVYFILDGGFSFFFPFGLFTTIPISLIGIIKSFINLRKD